MLRFMVLFDISIIFLFVWCRCIMFFISLFRWLSVSVMLL